MLDFLASHLPLFYLLIAIVGLIIGSFLNVVIYRLPILLEKKWRQECLESLIEDGTAIEQATFNLAVPASHCPHCQTPIKIWHNIPLLSYIWLRGKCSVCAERIPFRYFLVELLTCVFSLIVAFAFGISGTLIGGLLFTWLLIAITFIDLEHQIIPDLLTYPLLWMGLFFSCFGLFSNSKDAILGVVIAYSFFWLLGKTFYWVTKKEGIGHGDYKLLAAVAAWLGWELLPLVLLLSGLLGIVFGGGFLLIRKLSKNTPIPFGPFIALAAWVALIWGFDITQLYLHFFGITWTNM